AWTDFLDSLLRTHAAVAGVPGSEVVTNQRINIADGGVDSEVRGPIAPDPSGWFPAPTCWRYKAEEYKSYTPSSKNKKLAAEMPKESASALIRQGFAYRLCICDSMPPRTRTKWNRALEAARDSINPDAPDPRVLTADDVAAWANQYPGLLRLDFHPEFR